MDENKKELNAKVLEAYGGDETELKYAQKVIQTINDDLELREKASPVFNGLQYSVAYEYNQKKAINYFAPRNLKDDMEISFGIPHEKIIAFIAIFLKYIFKYRIKCYDDKGRLVRGMGKVYELAIEFSRKVEQFIQTLGLIYWETFTQGNAFVLEDWEVKMIDQPKAMKEGKQVAPDAMDYTYEFMDGLTYEKGEPIQTRRARSRVLDGRQVIFGNPEIEQVQDQPHITIEVEMTAEAAEQTFGTLKRWKQVPKEATDIEEMTGEKTTLFDSTRQKDPKKTFIIHYHWDKDNNRMNVFVNGLMMLPSATPLSVFYPRGNYPLSNVASERLRGSIYARSVPAKTKFNADFIDWALKMLANKFQQGIDPAILVKAGKYTLTRDMFRGGQITHGVSRDDFEKADPDNQGVTAPEFSFVKLLKEIIETQTVNPVVTGEGTGADTLGQEVMLENNQRDKLGFLLDGLMLGAMDLVLRRAETIESKYTIKQKETMVDGKKISVFSDFTVNVAGVENVVVFDEALGEEAYDFEGERDRLFKRAFDDKKAGYPTEYYLVNPNDLREKRYNIVAEILPERVKDTNLQLQVMWQDFAQRLNIFGGANNIEEMKKEYLEVSGKPDSIFSANSPLLEQMQQGEQVAPNPQMPRIPLRDQMKI